MTKAALVLAFSALPFAATATADDAEFFEKRIRPALADHCVKCHGAEKQKGGLRLDSRAALLAGGDSGTAIVAGKPAASLLIKAVRHEDAELKMPPPKEAPKLADSVIADLAAWIERGAVWPGGDAPVAATAEKFDLAERKARLPWIWQTPQKQRVPDAPGAMEVDRFLNAKLRGKGLAPAPPADALTWLRRAHFAITGLPPTLGEMAAFKAAHRTNTPYRAYEQTAEALLASPHFGERWARHWMDLVRYAESRGHEDDFIIANAWRYRDYLIRALNADVPYDRFVAEHIAGDTLPPRLGPAGENESVLATGWAFLGEEIHNPVDIRQDECERVDNKVDVLSKTFLGLTVACARCHDHKFDAISQRDYYALAGFVLGSPFRQARIETMLAHDDTAKKLAQLRKAHAPKIAAALAEALRPGLGKIAPHLLAARRVLFGEKAESVAAATGLEAAKLAAWLEQLKAAVASPAHPLHAFTMLAHQPDAENAEKFPALLAKRLEVPAPAMPKDAKVIVDFTAEGRTPWKVDGPSFGTRPLAAGEFVFSDTTRVMPYGAAVRDAFWNKLALSPGTEMDSGNLAAAARAGRTLLTPKFTLGAGRLHYLIRGKARVYAGVDSHIMLTGGLHDALLANFDTGGALKWVTHSLDAYAGHRAHLEFFPIDDAPLEVLMVVESAERPAWLPPAPWSPRAGAPSLRAVADDLQAAFARAATFQDPALAPLAAWLVQNAALLDANTANINDALRSEETALAQGIRWDSPTAVTMADVGGVDESILIRGKPTRPGVTAPRGLPEVFGTPRITTTATSGRAELARQLTDPANPLVARVIVNRVWHHLFGRGLVPTPDNFGQLGERPTHPELLDHLAWQFVHEDGWSLKKLIRRLVLTDAFARDSRAADPRAAQLDPANHLLHRYPVRRLEAEAIRDALLVVSGRFDAKQFGPPVPVHLTDFIVGRGRPSRSGPLDGAGRRSLYISARRNFLPTMMLAFDLPTPFSTVGRRNVTNVPAQSLVLMNDPFVREQAAVWAARLDRELPAAPDDARIVWLFETAFTRPPTAADLAAARESLADIRALHADGKNAWGEFCHALLGANDFIYLR